MNRTAGEMIEYLKEFDTESKCKVLVADPERRKRYDKTRKQVSVYPKEA